MLATLRFLIVAVNELTDNFAKTSKGFLLPIFHVLIVLKQDSNTITVLHVCVCLLLVDLSRDLFKQVLSRNGRRFEFFILDLVYRDNKTCTLLAQSDRNSTMVKLVVLSISCFSRVSLFLYISGPICVSIAEGIGRC